MQKYYVSEINTKSMTGMTSIHSIGNAITVPTGPSLEIDVTVCILEVGKNMLKDLEHFERYLKGGPDWASDEMINEALREKYPERYL